MKKNILFTLFLILAVLIAGGFVGLRIFQYNTLVTITQETITRAELLQVPILPQDPIIGDKKAPLTLVTFEDLGCEGCAKQNTLLTNLQEKHPGKVKLIWKSLSVTNIPYSTKRAHEYAFCANQQQAFSAFKDYAYANLLDLTEETLITITEKLSLDNSALTECLTSGQATFYSSQNELIAQSFQIQAVPTFFFNDTQIATPQSIIEWEQVLGL